MPKPIAPDLSAFVAVANARSFARAAAQLGLSQSALSQTLRALEARIGVPLLRRSTRSVSPTDAGERLLRNVGPRLEEIEAELAALSAMREKPAGTIRITADEPAARSAIWPVLERFLPAYPDIRVELIVDYGLTDIVAERYDAGVRLGGMVAKDMIAVRIGPDTRMAVVGAPSYFAKRPLPRKPQDLTDHICINLRLPTRGGLYAWEFEKGGRELNVRVEGQLTFNTVDFMFSAAVSGFGLAYLAEDHVKQAVAQGQLVQVLGDWCQPFSGYHLYYPSRRQTSAAFHLLVDALRDRGKSRAARKSERSSKRERLRNASVTWRANFQKGNTGHRSQTGFRARSSTCFGCQRTILVLACP